MWPKGLIDPSDNVVEHALINSGINHGTIRSLTILKLANNTHKTRNEGARNAQETQYTLKKATLTFNVKDSIKRIKAGSVADVKDTIANLLYAKSCGSTFEEPTGVNFSFWNSAAVVNHVGWDISGSVDLSNVPQANGQARAHGEDGLFQDDTKFPEKPGRSKIIEGDTVEIKTRLDLSGADLSGASLRNTNMKQANLTNADMTAIDLSATDLTGADMMGANYTRLTHHPMLVLELY